MTTGQIATYANLDGIKGGLAAASVQGVLRNKLVYEFLYDIGYPSWARRISTGLIASGYNYFDLLNPNDFRQMRKVMVAPNYTDELEYIGDDDAKMFAAQVETTGGIPSGYWLGFDGTAFRRVFVDRPAADTYTMAVSYYRRIPFGDDTAEDFELNPYIPSDSQWPLVELLKKYYYGERYGIEDNRTQLADGEYQAWIARIRENPEKSAGAKYAYVS